MNGVKGRGAVLVASALVLIGSTGVVPMHATLPIAGRLAAPAVWVLPPPTPGTARAAAVANTTALNWSGYVEHGTGFIGAQVDWTVPTVAPSTTSKYSSAWVGIDGASNANLIQVGTEQDWVNGAPQYYAWTEILPAPSVPIGVVNPGDHVRAALLQQTPGVWAINFFDLTMHKGFTTRFSYGGPRTSAEFIVERPASCPDISCVMPLANFGTVNFDAAASSGSPADKVAVDMVNSSGARIAKTSAFGTHGNFSVTQPPSRSRHAGKV